jgi:hypothetical protein
MNFNIPGYEAHTTLDVVLARPEDMLKEGVEDTTNAERGLDDVRCELADCTNHQMPTPKQ